MGVPKSQSALTRKIALSKLSELKGSEKAVLVTLSIHGDNVGMNIFPSISTLAGECSVSLQTVRNAIKVLEKAEYIKTLKKGGVVKGKNLSNEYAINIMKFGFEYPSLKR